MRKFTQGELDVRCRDQVDAWRNAEGDYSEGATPMASGTLMRFMDSANTRVHNAFAESDEDWRLTTVTSSLVTGSGSYSLPTDHYKLRAAELEYPIGSGRWEPLDRSTIHGASGPSYGLWDGSTSPGRPRTYREVDETIEYLPTPDQAYRVRLRYVPCAQRLTSSLDLVEGYSGYDELVVLDTCIRGLKSQEHHEWAASLQATYEELKVEFLDAVKTRDRASAKVGTPRRLARRRGGSRY